jgi:hypothetical protein
MKTYTCELCGLEGEWTVGVRPRWCPEDRQRGQYLARQAPRHTDTQVTTALASTLVTHRLAIEAAIHALVLAALARHLGWDDSGWLQKALDDLTDVITVSEAIN